MSVISRNFTLKRLAVPQRRAAYRLSIIPLLSDTADDRPGAVRGRRWRSVYSSAVSF